MTKLLGFLSSTRPKTLLLASSGIITGNACAWNEGKMDGRIFALTLVTALLLQILSNLFNDIGDHGKADTPERIGPKRGLQNNIITLQELKIYTGVILFLTVISGISLILLAFDFSDILGISFFIGLGLLSILAAAFYTVGKRPYGYRMLGDFSVFIFFGLVAVYGSYYIQTQIFSLGPVGPAIAIGMLSAGVLNINNMRDTETDRKSGKITLALFLGERRSRMYHRLIWFLPILLLDLYARDYMDSTVWTFYIFITFGILAFNIVLFNRVKNKIELNRLLGLHALSTFMIAALTGGIYILN